MIFVSIAVLALGVTSTQAAATGSIAGYEAVTDVDSYLNKDLIQKQLETIMSNEECDTFDDGKDYYNTGDGTYLQTIPTYGFGSGESVSDEYNEYIQWAGGDNFFHKSWVAEAFDKSSVSEGDMVADFGLAFPNDYLQDTLTPAGECIGFEECVKKATSYVYNFVEVVQLMQAAIDKAKDGCIYSRLIDDGSGALTARCEDAVKFWDAAVAIYVGSLEGPDGFGGDGTEQPATREYGVSLYALADKRCRNYKQCGAERKEGNNKFRTAPINTKILAYFSAGQMAAKNGDYAIMEDYKKKISAKTVVPWIQGTFRYAWRLSTERARAGNSTSTDVDPLNTSCNLKVDGDLPDPASAIIDTEWSAQDKEVGEAAAFALGAVPKLWACSKKAAELVWPQIAPGGGVAGAAPVNFQLVKTAFECNYKCLHTSCKEVGSLYDGKDKDGKIDSSKDTDKQIDNKVDIRNGAKTCNDVQFGTDPKGYATCKKAKGKIRKKKCKCFLGDPGINGRDKPEYFQETLP